MQYPASMKRIVNSLFAAGMLAGIVLAAGVPTTFAAPPPGNASLRPAEWNAIQQVIGDQVKALKAGDGTKAISYSAPGIRQQFRTPEGFLRMVRANYRALLDARYSTFLDGAVVDGITIQPLQLVLPDNTVVVALYTMVKQKEGDWRIAGCVIAPSTVQAT